MTGLGWCRGRFACQVAARSPPVFAGARALDQANASPAMCAWQADSTRRATRRQSGRGRLAGLPFESGEEPGLAAGSVSGGVFGGPSGVRGLAGAQLALCFGQVGDAGAGWAR